MKIFTIGYTHKSAKEFFYLLKVNKIEVIVDIRLNNTSQLAGFTKQKDLEYFASVIGKISYFHYPQFAPGKDLLKRYQKKQINWEDYEKEFKAKLKEIDLKDFLKRISKFTRICLLCSEEKADQCHRRLVAEYLQKQIPDVEIEHI